MLVRVRLLSVAPNDKISCRAGFNDLDARRIADAGPVNFIELFGVA